MNKQLTVVSLSLIALTLISPVTSDKPKFRDDAAERVTWKFKDKPRKGIDVSVVLLDWEPSSMIENNGGISKNDLGVEIRAGDNGEFLAVEKEPRLKGGKYSYDINIVPCLDQHIRFSAKNEDGITYFDFPTVIPASSSEDIASSSYDLMPAQDGKVEQSDDMLTVSWSPTQCASSYLVNFQGSGDMVEREVTDTSLDLNLAELVEECGQYDVTVTAVREEMFSDSHFISTVSTAPAASSVDQLEVEMFPESQSVMARWYGYKSMPCVSKYSVSLCAEDGSCEDSVSLTLDDSLAYVQFSSKKILTECSSYSLLIKPEYDGQQLEEKRVAFRTRSPAVAEVSSVMSPVSVEVTDQQVHVTWPQIKCASHYRVYQQAVTSPPASEWDFVTNTTFPEVTIPGVPCTQYIYGVRAVLDGEESEIVKAAEPVMTPLDSSEPYTAPGLTVAASTSSVEVSWDHASCVETYRLQLCPPHGDCVEQVLTSTSSHVHGRVEDLAPCTTYNLHIFATTDGKEIQGAASSMLQTEAPAPVAPENFSLVEDPVSQKLELTWSGQECVTQYKVHSVLDQDEATQQLTSLRSLAISNLLPCTDYKYAVSAMVGDVEGPMTEYIGEKVPPKLGEESKPSLHISQKYNNTVELQLLSPDVNKKCEVESYDIKYHNLGDDISVLEATIPITDLAEENVIVLDDFPLPVDNGMKIEGRIKYLGYDWSPWVSSQSKVPEIVLTEGDGIIVPIVIGALVAVVILVAVIFFVIRRKKRSQRKYDCDKEDHSESKKLNEAGEP